MSGAPVHAYVLRDTGMSVVFWLAAAGTAVLVGDTVLRGAWAALAATAGIAGFVLIILVLMVKPYGLFGQREIERV